jgi:hypothetical protein
VRSKHAVDVDVEKVLRTTERSSHEAIYVRLE